MWDIILEEQTWRNIFAIILVALIPFFVRQAFKDAKEAKDCHNYKKRILHRMTRT